MKRVLWRGKAGPQRAVPAPSSVEERLQRVDIFKGLTEEEIKALFRGVMVQECTPGTVFFTPEDAAERLFVLKEGEVELYRLTASGKRLVTRRIGPSTVFGEMGLLGQSMQGHFAEATQSSLVCVATREDLQRLLKERPDVALRLLETIGNHMRQLEDRLEQAVFSPVRVRLAAFLLAHTDAQSGELKGYTHQDIGDTIGALRQTVTEALDQMEHEGLVELGHRRITVRSRQGLEAIARSGEG